MSADWAKEVLDTAAQAEQQPEQQAQKFDYAQDLLDRPQASATMGTYETPTGEPYTDRYGYAPKPRPGKGEIAGFVTNLLSNIPRNPVTRAQIIEKRTGKPAGFVGGRPVVADESGLQYVDSGPKAWLGETIANTPEMAGSIAGSFVSPIAGTALGAAGGKGLKQIMSGLLFDEPQSTTENVEGMMTEGAINAATAGLAKGASSIYNRAAVRNAEKFDLPQAKAMQDRIKASTGIDLDFAQAGNIRQLRDLKKWASKYPGDASEIIETLDRRQAGQVADAIQDKVLRQLSSVDDINALAANGVNAARESIKLAKLKRGAETRDLYRAADSKVLDDDVANRLKSDVFIESQLKRVLGNKLYRSEFDDLGIDQQVRDRTVKAWDLVLRNIRDAQETAIRSGELNKSRILGQRAEKLEGELADAAPEYAAARKAWRDATKEYVEPLEKGAIGVLANIESPALASRVAKVMDDVLANPMVTANMRTVITNQQGQQAWLDLVKTSLSKSFDKAAKETQGGDVVNLAGKFRQAMIGTPQRQKAMDKALGGVPAAQTFSDVMDALQMIARESRNRGGSDTAFNQEITRLQKGGLGNSVARMVTNPLGVIRETLDQRVLERNSRAFAEALTDPTKLKRLKELRMLKPSTERSLAILSVVGLGEGAARPAVDAVTSPGDVVPQAPQSQQ